MSTVYFWAMILRSSPTFWNPEDLFSFQLKILKIPNRSTAELGENPSRKTQLKKKKARIITPVPSEDTGLKVTADYIRYETDQLEITLWGGIDINTVSRLRATLHMQLTGNNYVNFRDTADLYSHSQTDRLIKQAAEKLEVSTLTVSHAIAGLTKELETYRQQKREEKRNSEQKQELQSIDRFSSDRCKRPGSFYGARI
jgi:DNA primase